MKKVNLRDLYPDVYKTDHFVEVTEDVQETIRAAERAEDAYDRRMYRYKAHYSLDCDNGIENAVLLKPPDAGNAFGGKAAAGTALCRSDVSAGEAGQADLCPVLPGYVRERDSSSGGCRPKPCP